MDPGLVVVILVVLVVLVISIIFLYGEKSTSPAYPAVQVIEQPGSSDNIIDTSDNLDSLQPDSMVDYSFVGSHNPDHMNSYDPLGYNGSLVSASSGSADNEYLLKQDSATIPMAAAPPAASYIGYSQINVSRSGDNTILASSGTGATKNFDALSNSSTFNSSPSDKYEQTADEYYDGPAFALNSAILSRSTASRFKNMAKFRQVVGSASN